jgi:SAM-dependent methyltransferase
VFGTLSILETFFSGTQESNGCLSDLELRKPRLMATRTLLRRLVVRLLPDVFYYLRYRRANEKLGDQAELRSELFRRLIENSEDFHCLQIGARDRKYGPDWTSVDLFDESDYIDYQYDVHDLPFPDQTFDLVVCNAILEHVEYPAKAISELHRVLKYGGKIWVEVPFVQPYHASPNDYWRVTPLGMRIWLGAFQELNCGLFRIEKSTIYTGVFFYGEKPQAKYADKPVRPLP